MSGFRDEAAIARALAAPPKPALMPHDHAEYVKGCFRCDLSADEIADVEEFAAEVLKRRRARLFAEDDE